MERKKALVCGVMLARSNMGFGLPCADNVRSAIKAAADSRRFPVRTVTGAAELLIGDRAENESHIDMFTEEAEGWVRNFELDSFTDQDLADQYPDAALTYDIAAISDYDVFKRFEAVFRSAKTVDMFYTPENKAAADSWIENQAKLTPTGISFMVGFNYAMSQVKALIEGKTPG